MRQITAREWIEFIAATIAGSWAWLVNDSPNSTERYYGAVLCFFGTLWLCHMARKALGIRE